MSGEELASFKPRFAEIAQNIAQEEGVQPLSDSTVNWLWNIFKGELKAQKKRSVEEATLKKMREFLDKKHLEAIRAEDEDECVGYEIDLLESIIRRVEAFEKKMQERFASFADVIASRRNDFFLEDFYNKTLMWLNETEKEFLGVE